MTELSRDAYDRRAAKAAIGVGNYEQLDAMVNEFQTRPIGSIDIMQMTKDEAADLLRQSRSDARASLQSMGAISNGPRAFAQSTRDAIKAQARIEMGLSQDAYDLLTTIARGGAKLSSMPQATQQNFILIQALQTQSRLNQLYGPSTPAAMPPPAPLPGPTASSLLPSADIPQDAIDFINDVDTQAARASTAQDKLYTRFGRMLKSGGMTDLFQDSIIRNSAYAMVGLAAFGFIYSARKERTQEEIQGPPLLPGGSAYESDIPRSMPSISDLKYLNPTTAAMSYKINLSGSQADVEKFQELAGGVARGPINTTMYDGLPRLGRDPYSNVASSF
jgi:hypothetical protein